jgi:NaMN:DMB phosphoribosyltransferase
MPDAIESMELVLGSDRTGFISGVSAKIDACENFNLVNSENTAHYIITLAEKAFDTSGIAFSKINNKKLLIKINNSIFKNTGVTPNPLSSSSFAQNAIITVTACGTKVQSVVGGSMSFL